MTKNLRMAKMKRTELETKHLKNKMDISLKSYRNQRDFYSNNKLSMKSIAGNKEFWKTIALFFLQESINFV